MERQLCKFDLLIQELECQVLNHEEQLLLLAGEGSGIQLMGSNNCACQGNNCQCADNCSCNGNNCQCSFIAVNSPYVCALNE